MKSTMSYTDQNGITVELSTSADASSLRRLFLNPEPEDTEHYLVESFPSSLLEMPSVLLQAHQAICRNLQDSACSLLLAIDKKNTSASADRNTPVEKGEVGRASDPSRG